MSHGRTPHRGNFVLRVRAPRRMSRGRGPGGRVARLRVGCVPARDADVTAFGVSWDPRPSRPSTEPAQPQISTCGTVHRPAQGPAERPRPQINGHARGISDRRLIRSPPSGRACRRSAGGRCVAARVRVRAGTALPRSIRGYLGFCYRTRRRSPSKARGSAGSSAIRVNRIVATLPSGRYRLHR